MASNTAVYAAGNLFSRLFDIVTIFILARYLGVQDFGKFSFAFAYVGLFFVLTDWGVNAILVREMSKNRNRGLLLFASGISLKLGLSLLGVAVVGASLILLPEPSDVKVLTAIVSLNLIISFRFPSFKDVFEVPLISSLKLRFSVLAAIVNRVLTFVAILIAVWFRSPLWLVALVYTLAALPAFALLVSFSFQEVRPAFRARVGDSIYLLKEGFPIGLSGIFFIIVFQFDMFLLSRFWTNVEIGLYSAGRRMTEPLELVPTAIFFSILPIMSQTHALDKTKISRIYAKALLYAVLAAALLTGILSLSAGPLTGLLFGKSFSGAALPLMILSFYLPFIFIWHICGSVFIARNRQSISSLIWFLALVLNVGLNLLVIPRAGYIGASWTRLGTGITVAVLGMAGVSRLIGPISLVPLLKIGLLVAVPVVFFKAIVPTNPWLASLFFSAIFGVGILVFRVLNRDDLAIMGGLFRLGRRQRAVHS